MQLPHREAAGSDKEGSTEGLLGHSQAVVQNDFCPYGRYAPVHPQGKHVRAMQ